MKTANLFSVKQVLGFLVLVIGTAVGITLVQTPQDVRREAAVICPMVVCPEGMSISTTDCSCTYATPFPTRSLPTPTSAPAPCTDSDGGKNYTTSGYVTLAGSTTRHQDSCTLSNGVYTLYETYCNGSTVGTEAYQCPGTCSNGACVPITPPTPTPAPSCTIALSPNPFSSSVNAGRTLTAAVSIANASVSSVTFTSDNTAIATVSPSSDSASPFSTVVTGKAVGSARVTARVMGTGISSICSATVPVSITTAIPTPTSAPICFDSDNGLNYSVKGYVSAATLPGQNWDSCSGSVLTERYCSGNSPATQQYTCPYGCSDGKCNPAPTSTPTPQATCTDSDGGKKYYISGYVTLSNLPNTRYSDSCSVENGVFTLNETYCNGSTVGNEAFRCPGTCSNGACIVTGDVDRDGDVDIFDYNLLVTNFGSTVCGNVADIQPQGGDCDVDIFDYNLLIQQFSGNACITIACPVGEVQDPNTCQCVTAGGGGGYCPDIVCPVGEAQDPNTCQCVVGAVQ